MVDCHFTARELISVRTKWIRRAEEFAEANTHFVVIDVGDESSLLEPGVKSAEACDTGNDSVIAITRDNPDVEVRTLFGRQLFHDSDGLLQPLAINSVEAGGWLCVHKSVLRLMKRTRPRRGACPRGVEK